jgi:hypothetical protein
MLPDASCTTDKFMGAVLALDLGLFPLLLDDADADWLPLRTSALSQ